MTDVKFVQSKDPATFANMVKTFLDNNPEWELMGGPVRDSWHFNQFFIRTSDEPEMLIEEAKTRSERIRDLYNLRAAIADMGAYMDHTTHFQDAEALATKLINKLLDEEEGL